MKIIINLIGYGGKDNENISYIMTLLNESKKNTPVLCSIFNQKTLESRKNSLIEWASDMISMDDKDEIESRIYDIKNALLNYSNYK